VVTDESVSCEGRKDQALQKLEVSSRIGMNDGISLCVFSSEIMVVVTGTGSGTAN
jgi:hypothetical protein